MRRWHRQVITTLAGACFQLRAQMMKTDISRPKNLDHVIVLLPGPAKPMGTMGYLSPLIFGRYINPNPIRLCPPDTLGLNQTGHMSFLTRQNRMPNLPDRSWWTGLNPDLYLLTFYIENNRISWKFIKLKLLPFKKGKKTFFIYFFFLFF